MIIIIMIIIIMIIIMIMIIINMIIILIYLFILFHFYLFILFSYNHIYLQCGLIHFSSIYFISTIFCSDTSFLYFYYLFIQAFFQCFILSYGSY
jgi:hypothetical protein